MEEATQELSESIQSVRVEDGVIQWTDNRLVNEALECFFIEGNELSSSKAILSAYSSTYLRLKVDNEAYYTLINKNGYTYQKSISNFPYELYIDINGDLLNLQSGEFVEFNLTPVIYRQKPISAAITRRNVIEEDITSIKKVNNEQDNLLSSADSMINSLMQLVVPNNQASLIYKNIGSEKLITSNEKLSDNPTKFQSDVEVQDILKLDCEGVTDFRDVFGGQNYGGNLFKTRPLRYIALYNMTPGTSFQRVFAGLENLKVVYIYNSDFSAVKNLEYFINGCTKLREIDLSELDLSNVLYLNQAVAFCSKLKSIKFPANFGNTSGVMNWQSTFLGCYELEELDFSTCTFKVGQSGNTFQNCRKLHTLNLGMIDWSEATGNIAANFIWCLDTLKNFSGYYNMKKSYSLKTFSVLTHESALNCIAGLYDLTEGGTVTDYTAQTLTFHPDVTAQLTEEEIAEATAKGWNIA